MENQTVDEMIKEYGVRLGELENMFYDLNGFYPMYDCPEFWNDRQVSIAECLLEVWWEIHNTRINGETQ